MHKVFYESDFQNALAHKEWLDSLFNVLRLEEDTAEPGPGGGFVQAVPKPLEEPEQTRTRVAVALGLAPVRLLGDAATSPDRLALRIRQRLYPKLDRVEAEPAAEASEPPAAEETAAEETAAPPKGELPKSLGPKVLEILGALDPPVHTFHQLRKLIATGTEERPWYQDIKGIGPETAATLEAAAVAAPPDEEE